MKKVLLLIALAFLVAGCGDPEVVSEGPFIGGVDGVAVSFKEGAPPTRIQDSSSQISSKSINLVLPSFNVL